MSRRRRYEINRGHSSTFTLNVTSMTDMFTIMLVFLLQSYSVSEVQLIPDKGQTLPVSNSEANATDTLQVSLTKTELKIDDKVIATLNNNQDFSQADLEAHDSNFIKPLFEALQKLAAEAKAKDEKYQQDLAAGTLPVTKDPHGMLIQQPKPSTGILEGKIIVKADQDLPYGLMRKVMYTASMAGFPKMKMATVVGR